MKTGKLVVLAATVMSLISTASSRGVTFSDFESPTYTSGTSFIGVDGWVVLSGTASRARVTPTTNPDDLSFWPIVLEGSQSAFVNADWVGRTWNGLESYVGDGLRISWLVRKDAFSRADMYMTYDVAGFITPVGVLLDASGNIKMLAPDSGTVDSGFDYLTNKTYRMTMELVFSANTMTATAQNLTDGGPVVSLGSVFYGNAFEASLVAAGANGGLIMNERDGLPTIYDDIQVVPEPSSALLLTLGGLLFIRRRTGKIRNPNLETRNKFE